MEQRSKFKVEQSVLQRYLMFYRHQNLVLFPFGAGATV